MEIVVLAPPGRRPTAHRRARPAGRGILGSLDRTVFDLALTAIPPGPGASFAVLGKFCGGFAKNGCVVVQLPGSTPVNADLTNLGSVTGATGQAGDTSLTTANTLIFNNLSNQAVVLSPGASNPARLPTFSGTSPTSSIPGGGVFTVWGKTVNRSIQRIKF
jgi:hypothetical protein